MPGGYWLDDNDCGNSYYRWTAAAGAVTAVVDTTEERPPRAGLGSTIVGGVFYTGEGVCSNACTRAFVVARDIATGAVVSSRRVRGGIAGFPHAAEGSWWTSDPGDATLYRAPLPAGVRP